MRWIVLLALLAAFTGCVIPVEDNSSGTEVTHVSAPPPGEVRVEWDDCRTVLYREYFDCDWRWISAIEYYRDEYRFDDDDLLVLVYIARRANVGLHEVV